MKAEQIRGSRPHITPGERRYQKRKATRAIRRAAKRDPEGAPTKLRQVLRGWVA